MQRPLPLRWVYARGSNPDSIRVADPLIRIIARSKYYGAACSPCLKAFACALRLYWETL
jgi:hypothetical protein